MRVCQFRHFGKWTTFLRGSLRAAYQEEQLSILQTLRHLSNQRELTRDMLNKLE
jgi:hypothetical protein